MNSIVSAYKNDPSLLRRLRYVIMKKATTSISLHCKFFWLVGVD